jgi:hypothetical protein
MIIVDSQNTWRIQHIFCENTCITFIYILSVERFFKYTLLVWNLRDSFEYHKYFIRQSGDLNWIFISHIENCKGHFLQIP